MSLVVDASVIVKWLLQDPAREYDTERATALMQQVLVEGAGVMQPVHWLAEVAAVLVTADDRYARAAQSRGQVLSLSDWARA